MPKTMKIHDSAIERFARNLQEEQDRLTQEFLQTLQIRMAELSMSQSDMAYTLGKSRAYVSKLFTKGQNLTIKTMVELSHSLDMKLAISSRRMWVDLNHAPKAVHLQNGWTPTANLTCVPTRVTPPKMTQDLKGAWEQAPSENLDFALQRIG